jgi:hypothetical protein
MWLLYLDFRFFLVLIRIIRQEIQEELIAYFCLIHIKHMYIKNNVSNNSLLLQECLYRQIHIYLSNNYSVVMCCYVAAIGRYAVPLTCVQHLF